jgi:hypothetical protein
MMPSKTTLFFVFSSSLALHATELVQNGDFTKGFSGWNGAGKIVQVDETGQPTTSGGFPVLEIPASRNSNATCEQRLRLSPDAKQVCITVEAKTSPDFVINLKAPQTALNFGSMTLPTGSLRSGTSMPTEKANFSLMLISEADKWRSSTWNRLTGEWKTIKHEFVVNPGSRRLFLKLQLMTAPGEGNILIRSVKAEEIK